MPMPRRVDQALEDCHALFVCGGVRVNPRHERSCLDALRRAAHRERAIGALSTASYLLVRAGLLGGYRCTIHWENRAAFEEDFPHLTITGTLYEIDRNRLTCSGGAATWTGDRRAWYPCLKRNGQGAALLAKTWGPGR
ncbi:AraC family transcriptional regulator [Paracoccus yeei]